VTLNRKHQKTNGINVMIDIGMVASAAAGAPLPIPTGQEIGIQAEQKTFHQQNEQYLAPGEQVFAIQYKKLKFKPSPGMVSGKHPWACRRSGRMSSCIMGESRHR
jgi:hypothetical protein